MFNNIPFLVLFTTTTDGVKGQRKPPLVAPLPPATFSDLHLTTALNQLIVGLITPSLHLNPTSRATNVLPINGGYQLTVSGRSGSQCTSVIPTTAKRFTRTVSYSCLKVTVLSRTTT